MRCRNCGWENPDTNHNCEKCGSAIEAQVNVQPAQPEPAAFHNAYNTNSPARATVRETDVFRMGGNSPAHNEPAAATTCPCCGFPAEQGDDNCRACGTKLSGSPYPNPAPEPIRVNQEIRNEYSNPAPYSRVNNPTVNERVAQIPQPTVNERPQQGMHCINCGSLLAPNARFCAACGAPVGNQPMTPPQRPKKPFGGTIAGFTDPGNMGIGSFCTLKPIAWGRERIEYQPISYTGERIILNRSNTDANNQTITSSEQASLTFKDGEWYLEDLSPNRSTMIRVDRPVKLNDGDIIMLGNRMFEFNK